MKHFWPVLVAALALVACATDPGSAPVAHQPTNASAAADIAGRDLKSLTLSEALSLVSAPPFASAKKLAALRPPPRHGLRGLHLEVYNEFARATARSRMQFVDLPDGLEYLTHEVEPTRTSTALRESWIGVHGVAVALYWNSRMAESGMGNSTDPRQIRLIEGNPFDPTSSYVIQVVLPGGPTITKTCRPTASFSASTLHPMLSGMASRILCEESESQDTEVHWYLWDAQRYVPYEIMVRSEVLARFKIIGVQFE